MYIYYLHFFFYWFLNSAATVIHVFCFTRTLLRARTRKHVVVSWCCRLNWHRCLKTEPIQKEKPGLCWAFWKRQNLGSLLAPSFPVKLAGGPPGWASWIYQAPRSSSVRNASIRQYFFYRFMPILPDKSGVFTGHCTYSAARHLLATLQMTTGVLKVMLLWQIGAWYCS